MLQRLICKEYPNKYLKNGRYEETSAYKKWADKKNKTKKDKPQRFIITEKGDRVKIGPKNKKVEKYLPISGQAVYTGMSYWNRTAMVLYLKDYFRIRIREQLSPVESYNYPVIIKWKLFTTINQEWDTSNMWIYGKILEDTLVDEGIIKDDGNSYITYPPTAPHIVPIESWEDRKLVFEFHTDKRKILKKFSKYVTNEGRKRSN